MRFECLLHLRMHHLLHIRFLFLPLFLCDENSRQSRRTRNGISKLINCLIMLLYTHSILLSKSMLHLKRKFNRTQRKRWEEWAKEKQNSDSLGQSIPILILNYFTLPNSLTVAHFISEIALFDAINSSLSSCCCCCFHWCHHWQLDVYFALM